MNVKKINVNQLSEAERQAIRKLKELKTNGLKLLGLDYDGTIYDRHASPPYNSHQAAIDLALNIMKAGVNLGLITSRDASIKKILFPPLLRASQEIADLFVFVGGANGSNLTEIKNGEKREIYNHCLILDQIKTIIDVYNELSVLNLDPKSKKVIERFLTEDWSGYVPNNLFTISKENPGVWVEQSKVSLILPSNQKMQRKVMTDLQEKLKEQLGDELTIVWANDPFVHVSKKLEFDGKLLAIQTIMKELGTDEHHTAAFGDTPHGNDKGLLSLPYSFTNYPLEKPDLETPPYVLPCFGSPIESIYKAIRFLINLR